MDGSCIMYLVRHAQTKYDGHPMLIDGSKDPALSRDGRKQAQRLAVSLQRRNLAAVYTSPARRALHTAAILAEELPVPLCLKSALAEVNHGAWEGMTWSDVMDAYAADYGRFLVDPGTYGYTDGENLCQVQDRMARLLYQLGTEHAGQQIVVVSHKQAIRAFLSHLVGYPLHRCRDIDQDTACVNVLRYLDGSFLLGAVNQPAVTEECLKHDCCIRGA